MSSLLNQADLNQRFEIFSTLLKKWQTSINLVGPSTLAQMQVRHFKDSSQLVPIVPDAVRWADLGSGGGFPGIVIAFHLAEIAGSVVHLIESDARKCAFLREVSRETGVSTVIHNGRIEDVLPSLPPSIQAISARALAPMQKLIDLTQENLLKGSVGVFPKGQDVANELTGLTMDSRLRHELVQSTTDPRARIVVVRLEKIQF